MVTNSMMVDSETNINTKVKSSIEKKMSSHLSIGLAMSHDLFSSNIQWQGSRILFL